MKEMSSVRVIALWLAVSMILFGAGLSGAHAIGLGDIAVDSALNQPLRASVPLVGVLAEDRDAVDVHIATPEVYARHGVQHSAILQDLSLKVMPAAGGAGLQVLLRSSSSVREPLLFLLLEVRWSGRKLLREYTVLLDPPGGADIEMARFHGGPAPVASPLAARADEPAVTVNTAAEHSIRPWARSAPSHTMDDGDGGLRRYGPVEPQETLRSIAAAVRTNPGVTIAQVAASLYKLNPHAFDGDITDLDAGSLLFVPNPAMVRAVDAQAAERLLTQAGRKAGAEQPSSQANTKPAAESGPRTPSAPTGTNSRKSERADASP
ncbi:MAG: hypothetical protein L0H83_11050, partial [Salinisphaera sp.]|nr:hypothetical protein [Salinisphaera sp.]